MAFGSGKKVEALEAENARLQQWIAHLEGTDAVALAAQVEAARAELLQLRADADAARTAVVAARTEEMAARAQLAENLDEAVMHEAGLFTFSHRLQDAVAYKRALTDAQARMKEMVRSGNAIEAATTWTVNNSEAQGRKMVKDISTLMLRAYNAEADSLVRTLRPHSLAAAKSRLDKSALAIERLGKMMSIRISPDYHRLRFYELELTADYLLKKEQEKEEERARRAELRDQQKAAAEMKAALDRLAKEKAHYANLLTRLDLDADANAYALALAKLAELDEAITGVQQRAANIRTGHVYVISNVGAFGPDMVKIGMTRRLDPYDRVMELGDASVPFRFDVHAMVFHEDAVTLETQLHQRLATQKVNKINSRREFFYATPAEVRDILTDIAGAQVVEYRERPEAIEWHASGSVVRETQQPAADELDAIGDLDDAMSEGLYSDMADDATHADTAEDGSEVDDLAGIGGNEIAQEPGGTDQPQAARVEAVMPATEPVAAVGYSVQPEAGWYPDPHGIHALRYWDGTNWTEHVAK